MTVRLGVDTGGTFTDVVLYDEGAGEVTVTKTPSTPPDFDRGVLAGIDEALSEGGIDPGTVSFLSHGTTVGTNAVLEGDLPAIGLVTNEGLRDVIEIGDQTRPELYDLQQDGRPVPVPRRLRRGVPGRIDYAGDELDPLDEDRAAEAIDELLEAGAESIVVSMLFSYLNDDHERRVGDLIEERGADYALSSAVYPETREYERTVTTVLNEAVKRRVDDYLDRLAAGIRERGIDVPLSVMHSGGGVFGADQARTFALRTVLSGPAAGAVAARDVATRAGFEAAIGLDMGGTSADVSIVVGGELVRSTGGEIADLPIETPMIDINTVGAGGGSIAWIDPGGGLRVGPRSAGADPGPICYGRGGTEPTVTDAHLLLGRIDPDAPLAGDIRPVVDQTRERFAEAIADPLGTTVEAAALSVLRVADARMAREIRRVTVERGRDPAGFALVAFGGAGPLHAASVADHMEMTRVLVPPSPGVFSARGLLVADVRTDESRAYRGDDVEGEALEAGFAALEATQRERFEEMDLAAPELSRAVDARYVGQSYELTIPVPEGPLDEDAVDRIVAALHERHARRYGHARRDEPVEVVTLRSTARLPTPSIEARAGGATGDAARGEREVYFADDGFRTTAVVDRPALEPGERIEGPAVLAEAGSTALLPPGTAATVREDGSLLVDLPA